MGVSQHILTVEALVAGLRDAEGFDGVGVDDEGAGRRRGEDGGLRIADGGRLGENVRHPDLSIGEAGEPSEDSVDETAR